MQNKFHDHKRYDVKKIFIMKGLLLGVFLGVSANITIDSLSSETPEKSEFIINNGQTITFAYLPNWIIQ